MEVVRHQTPGLQDPLAFGGDANKDLEKEPPVIGRVEDVPAIVPTRRDVEVAGTLVTWWAGHRATTLTAFGARESDEVAPLFATSGARHRTWPGGAGARRRPVRP